MTLDVLIARLEERLRKRLDDLSDMTKAIRLDDVRYPYTQEDVAIIAGVAQSAVSKVEHGRLKGMSPVTVLRILKAYEKLSKEVA